MPTDVKEVPVTGPKDVPVVYVGAKPEQIQALVDESERCYLPMKFSCRSTKVCTRDRFGFYFVCIMQHQKTEI